MTLNADLLARRRTAVPNGLVSGTPAFAERALNAEIWDVDGNRYIDFAAGIATLNTGHCHPRVMAAARQQMERFTHTAFQVVQYPGYVELCDRLNALAPIEGKAKTFLVTTGAEATENAIKIARLATGRSAVIAFGGGFHGRTLLASSLTGKTEPYKVGFGQQVADIFHAPFPAERYGISTADSLSSIEFLFHTAVHPSRVAAIIVEPVQGEGGFNPAPPEFLQALRALCDAHGILLIIDEVQTGFGRTGKWFASEHSGVKPDLMAIAKSLGGGFPIAAVVGRADVMDMVHPGGLGSTYGGSPISCAAALAVLDVIEEEGLVARANAVGERITAFLTGLGRRNDVPRILNVRGHGAMIAFDLATLDVPERPSASTVKALQGEAFDRGLILLTCGPGSESIRLLMPLTIPYDILDEGLAILEQSLCSISALGNEQQTIARVRTR